MKRLLCTVLALGLGFAMVGLVKADDKPKKEKPAPGVLFQKMDKNSDGKLSQEEFVAKKKDQEKAKELFTKKDKDGDGSLSLEEFSAQGKKGGDKKPGGKKGGAKKQ